jgi:outer membrane protein OmpA-like peptidoglycan-associated protein
MYEAELELESPLELDLDAALERMLAAEVGPRRPGTLPPRPISETVGRFGTHQNTVASLPPEEKAKIKRMAGVILESYRPGRRAVRSVQLTGHADRDPQADRRQPGFTRAISQQRAVAVQRALQALTGPAVSARIRWLVQGVGATRLVVPNPRSEMDRSRNRRVEIVLTPLVDPTRCAAVAHPSDPNAVDPQVDELIAAKLVVPIVRVWAVAAQQALQRLRDQIASGGARGDGVANRHFHFDRSTNDQRLRDNINQALGVFNRVVNFINIKNVGDIYFVRDVGNRCAGAPACSALGGLGIAGQQIMFRREYATSVPVRGARAAMLLHECTHFVIGNVDDFASEWDENAPPSRNDELAKRGIPIAPRTRNYVSLLPEEATRNASSFAAYAIEVATCADRRFGKRDVV